MKSNGKSFYQTDSVKELVIIDKNLSWNIQLSLKSARFNKLHVKL